MLALPFTVLCLVHAPVVTALVVKKCASVDYFDPALAGGSMLDNATYGGEPEMYVHILSYMPHIELTCTAIT